MLLSSRGCIGVCVYMSVFERKSNVSEKGVEMERKEKRSIGYSTN